MKNFFGERIKTLRRNHGLIQQDLADEFKVSLTTLSFWENGKNFPEIPMLLNIAEFFNVTTDYLLGIENKHNQPINKAPLLTDEEKQVLSLYNAMDEDTKYTAMTTLEIFAKNSSGKNSKSNS